MVRKREKEIQCVRFRGGNGIVRKREKERDTVCIVRKREKERDKVCEIERCRWDSEKDGEVIT